MWRGVNRRHVLVVRDLNLELMAHLGLHQRATNHVPTPDARATNHDVLLTMVLGQCGLAAEAKSLVGFEVNQWHGCGMAKVN